MSRYYDLDKLKEMIEVKADTLIEGKEAFLYVAKWLDLLPPADVVPKSEFDKLLISETTEIHIAMEKLVKVRTEHPIFKAIEEKVVREIFEEIERFLYMHFRFCKEEIGNDDTKYLEGRLEQNTQIQNFIAELKKKYTEDQNDTEK